MRKGYDSGDVFELLVATRPERFIVLLSDYWANFFTSLTRYRPCGWQGSNSRGCATPTLCA